MPLITWTKEYSVEVQSLDTEHQKLFDMLNELHDAMSAGKGVLVAPAVLKRLVAYTREHFANEEGIMVRTNYPDYARHKLEHDNLTREVLEISKDFDAGKLSLTMKLLVFLRSWLQSHILGHDKQYIRHVQAAGVR